MLIKAPTQEGTLVPRVTLVQEGVSWYDIEPLNLFADTTVEVSASR